MAPIPHSAARKVIQIKLMLYKMNIRKLMLVAYLILSFICISWLLIANCSMRREISRFHPPHEKRFSEIIQEMKKVQQGDGEAAMNLAIYYQFVKSDFPASYFWLFQASKLKHPEATDDVLRDFEGAVFSIIPYDSPGYKELPPIEK